MGGPLSPPPHARFARVWTQCSLAEGSSVDPRGIAIARVVCWGRSPVGAVVRDGGACTRAAPYRPGDAWPTTSEAGPTAVPRTCQACSGSAGTTTARSTADSPGWSNTTTSPGPPANAHPHPLTSGGHRSSVPAGSPRTRRARVRLCYYSVAHTAAPEERVTGPREVTVSKDAVPIWNASPARAKPVVQPPCRGSLFSPTWATHLVALV